MVSHRYDGFTSVNIKIFIDLLKPLQLGLFRSDYLLHEDKDTHEISIKQVEFNTISSSFGALSYRAAGMHR